MNPSGVRVRVLRVTTFGNSVFSHGLKAMSRSRTARAKTECSMTWYLAIDRGDSPWSTAWLTHRCTVEGITSRSGVAPNNGTKWIRR